MLAPLSISFCIPPNIVLPHAECYSAHFFFVLLPGRDVQPLSAVYFVLLTLEDKKQHRQKMKLVVGNYFIADVYIVRFLGRYLLRLVSSSIFF